MKKVMKDVFLTLLIVAIVSPVPILAIVDAPKWTFAIYLVAIVMVLIVCASSMKKEIKKEKKNKELITFDLSEEWEESA